MGKATRILAFSTPRLEEARFSLSTSTKTTYCSRLNAEDDMRGPSCHLLSQTFKKIRKSVKHGRSYFVFRKNVFLWLACAEFMGGNPCIGMSVRIIIWHRINSGWATRSDEHRQLLLENSSSPAGSSMPMPPTLVWTTSVCPDRSFQLPGLVSPLDHRSQAQPIKTSFSFLKKYLFFFIYLAVLSHSMWDL